MSQDLGKSITVSFAACYSDPNNPRLGREEVPGYEDSGILFDAGEQDAIKDELQNNSEYQADTLIEGLVGVGWQPIDAIITWTHPDEPGKYLIVEGNRRFFCLGQIRDRVLQKEEQKLKKMVAGGSTYAKSDIEHQRKHLKKLKDLISETDELEVRPLKVKDPKDLPEALSRVLSTRHGPQGVVKWGNLATDRWHHARYVQLFEAKYPSEPLRWDRDVINSLCTEASLNSRGAKNQLRALSAYQHFTNEYEDQLPAGEEFSQGDYYLFQQVMKSVFVRQQFEIADEDRWLDEHHEKVVFEWVFKKPRGKTAAENKNIFFRHENVQLWGQMKRYDDKANTGFAARFNPSPGEYKNAPRMQVVKAEYEAHQANVEPADIIDQLMKKLQEIPSETLAHKGQSFRKVLIKLQSLADKFVKMIDAALEGDEG